MPKWDTLCYTIILLRAIEEIWNNDFLEIFKNYLLILLNVRFFFVNFHTTFQATNFFRPTFGADFRSMILFRCAGQERCFVKHNYLFSNDLKNRRIVNVSVYKTNITTGYSDDFSNTIKFIFIGRGGGGSLQLWRCYTFDISHKVFQL